MFRKSLFAAALACGLFAENGRSGEPHKALPVDEDGSEYIHVYAETWTVYYRRGNTRWSATTGLSYYHATRLRDDYIKKGYRAYVQRVGPPAPLATGTPRH